MRRRDRPWLNRIGGAVLGAGAAVGVYTAMTEAPSWALHVVPSPGWQGPGQLVPLDGTELITPWPDDWIVLRLTVGENMHWWEVRVLDEIRWSGTGPDIGQFAIVILKIAGDTNGDGETNLIDVAQVKSMNGADPTAPGNARFDLNSDDNINLIDVALCKSLAGARR